MNGKIQESKIYFGYNPKYIKHLAKQETSAKENNRQYLYKL